MCHLILFGFLLLQRVVVFNHCGNVFHLKTDTAKFYDITLDYFNVIVKITIFVLFMFEMFRLSNFTSNLILKSHVQPRCILVVVRVVRFAFVIVKRFYTEDPVAAIAVHYRNQRCEILRIINWR